MKKIAFILVLFFWAIAGSLSLNGQVNFSVTFDWDDSNCNCNEPVTIEYWIIVKEYPGGTTVVSDGWFSVTSKPEIYNGDASGLRDCVDEHPCYTVYVYMRYKDNTGVCCSGLESENTTGQALFSGSYSLANQIILN
ncbi:MAG: hypothetical protein K0B08_12405 [Bacteroidales bacterium]|nr:hypothetical protein [Bacteroidales bacterium]